MGMRMRTKVVVAAAVIVAVLVAAQDDNSWTRWAMDKFKQRLGLKNDQSIEDTLMFSKDKIEQVITGGQDSLGAKGKAYEAASGTYDKAKQTAEQAKQTAAEKAHDVKDKAQQYAEQASHKTITIKDRAGQEARGAAHTAEEARETVSRKAGEAEEKAHDLTEDEEGEQSSWVKEKAKEGYDAAKKRASKTLHNAKEMAKDMASPQYDDDEL